MSSELMLACTVCFGAADGALLTSARLGVLVMVVVTCGVLAAFGAFFLRLKKGTVPVSPPGNGDCPLFTESESA
jgi:hypothetical protein